MKQLRRKDCRREEGACIEGDTIYVQCQKPGKWTLFRKSEQHRGSHCKADKDAKAVLLKKYTNIR